MGLKGKFLFFASFAALFATVGSEAVNPIVMTSAPAAVTKPRPMPTPVAVIPSDWHKVADIKEAPPHAQFIGGLHLISYAPNEKRADHAHFVAWGKFEYISPQKFGDKSYSTELIAVRIDCAKSKFSQFRRILFDEHGALVVDLNSESKFESIPASFISLGVLKPGFSVAESALPDTCGRDAD